MGRAPARFTESDISRVLRVAKRLNVGVRIESKPDGTIVVQAGGDMPQLDNGGDQPNEWDREYGTQATEVRPSDSKPGR
jgi:hypothetical protein